MDDKDRKQDAQKQQPEGYMAKFRNFFTGGAQDTLTHATPQPSKKPDQPVEMKHANMNYYHEDDGK